MTFEERRQQITADLDRLVTTYLKQSGMPEDCQVIVEVIKKGERSRSNIFADENYKPVHKSFLTDLVVHGVTLQALVKTCQEKEFDFSDMMGIRGHGMQPDPEARSVVYEHLVEYIQDMVEYAGKGINHKELAQRIFKKTENKKDAICLLNQIKAVTGLYCDSDEERANLFQRFMEDIEEEERNDEQEEA